MDLLSQDLHLIYLFVRYPIVVFAFIGENPNKSEGLT